MEWIRGQYTLSTDKSRLDLERVHAFLSTVYWSMGIPKATIAKAVEHSVAFGLYSETEQVGFARVITDFATHAYVCDVYVEESHRGHGLAAWMMECMLAHPELQGLRRWMLITRDAHGLYRKLGFTEARPGAWMEIARPDIYR